MSLHTYTQHVQTWILDQDYKPLALVRLVDFRLEYHELDDLSFTANVLVSSDAYSYMSDTAERYVLYLRENIPPAVFCIERLDRSWAINIENGRTERAVKIAGRGNCSFFLWTCDIQPDPTNVETNGQTWSGYKDDVVKAFVRYSSVVGTAYDDPDGATRGIVGLTVAADKAEHPDEVTDYKLAGNLWESLYPLCLRDNWDVDMVWTPTWNGPGAAVTFSLETYYQGRGSDKTASSADPVVLSDLVRVLTKADGYRDAYKYATHGYNALGHEVVARAGVTNRIRRELRFDYLDPEKVEIAMAQADEEWGDTWEYIETPAHKIGPGSQDVWVGDRLSRYVDAIQQGAKDVRCTGIVFEYENDTVGTEKIKILLDDAKPKQEKKGGKHRPKIDGPELFYYWGVRDDGELIALPRMEDNTIRVTGTGGITVVRSTSDELVVDGSAVVTSNLVALGDTGAGAVPDADAQITWHGATPGYSFDAHDNQVDLTGPWTRIDTGDEYLRPTAFGDALKLFDDAQGLAFHITGDGDVYGNEQALGSPFRIIALTDYDMVASDHDTSKSGLHDLTVSGNIISQIDTTASRFEWLGGSDGEDAVKVRNWSVYSDTAGSTLRAQYNITNGLRLLDSDGATPVFTVAPSTGNSVWKAGATWTIEGDEYTLPTAYPATSGMALVGTDAGVLSWGAPAPAAHSHAHSDLSGVSANQHHNQNHALIDTTGHTASGLTTGHVLQATGATTYGFGAVPGLHDAVTIADSDRIDLGLTGQQITADLKTSGVAAATYGSATQVAQVAVDVYGRITSASNVTITGVVPAAHNLVDTTGHPVAGLTGGHVLTALSATTYGFAAPAVHHAAVTLSAALDSNLLSLSTQELGLDVQTANYGFFGPVSGAAAAPTFRAMVAADLPASGVAAATYGSATQVAQVAVDTYGRITSASNVTISGVAPSAHDILSASHGDTAAAAVADGSLIIGNVTPKWSTLAISVPAANVRNVLGIDNGETRPSWKTALDATAPSTLTSAAAAAAGTSLVFSHRDHVHPITTTVVSAASTIVATDASGYIRATQLEIGGSTYYIGKNGANIMRIMAANSLDLGAGTEQVRLQDGVLFPLVTNDVALGTTSYRWSNVATVLADISGDVTLAAGSDIIWGADTNLYRSAANTLKTDDVFVAADLQAPSLYLTPYGYYTGPWTTYGAVTWYPVYETAAIGTIIGYYPGYQHKHALS